LYDEDAMYSTEQIRQNYEQVLSNIAMAAKRVSRSPSSVKLVVVTKSHPVEAARAAIEVGASLLGENYAEEGLEKINAIGPIAAIEWHMIGHVQSRKVELVVRNYSLVHSLDSFKLAERINRESQAIRWIQPVLIQVNVSGEESKFGFRAWQVEQIPELVREIKNFVDLPYLQIRGLMTIPPYVDDCELSRPYFQKLFHLREVLRKEFSSNDWSELSMGMSSDYTVAVEEGATFVRVGTAILGERNYSKG
jgi:PLP dependent protein